MKIYLINLDALPWGPDLEAFAAAHRFRRIATLNSGTFTHTSVLGRLTGRLPSELVEGGIGNRAARLRRYYRWTGPDTPSLLGRLGESGWRTLIHNCAHDAWLSFLPRGLPPFDVRTGSWADRTAWMEHAWPGLELTDSYEQEKSVFHGWTDPALCASFYQRERAYIQSLQQPGDEPLFFYTGLNHWHDLNYYRQGKGLDAARRAMMDWLGFWNWSEPDALFWIFCDHGPACSAKMPPQDYTTWTLVRDNTGTARAWSPVAAGPDFYALACELAGLDPGPGASPPYGPAERDRIYFAEDARTWVTHYESVTASAARVTAWSSDGNPLELTQLTWMRHRGRWLAYRAPLDRLEHHDRWTPSFREPVERDLREALWQRIGWLRSDPDPRLPLGPMRLCRLKWRGWRDYRDSGRVPLD